MTRSLVNRRARGTLRAAGYEVELGSDLPRRVTAIRELAGDIEQASIFA